MQCRTFDMIGAGNPIRGCLFFSSGKEKTQCEMCEWLLKIVKKTKPPVIAGGIPMVGGLVSPPNANQGKDGGNHKQEE